MATFASANRAMVLESQSNKSQLGALDEWLSQRSAKPSTAVRIRQAPLSKVLKPR